MIHHEKTCLTPFDHTLYVRTSRATGRKWVPVGALCLDCGSYELQTVSRPTPAALQVAENFSEEHPALARLLKRD